MSSSIGVAIRWRTICGSGEWVRDAWVGICLERSLEMVNPHIGDTQKAGGAVCPAGPALPTQRLQFCSQITGRSPHLITSQALLEVLPEYAIARYFAWIRLVDTKWCVAMNTIHSMRTTSG